MLAYKSYRLRCYALGLQAGLVFLPTSGGSEDKRTERCGLLRDLALHAVSTSSFSGWKGGEEIVEEEDKYLMVVVEAKKHLETVVREGAGGGKRWSVEGGWEEFVNACQEGDGDDVDDDKENHPGTNDDEWLTPLQRDMEDDSKTSESIMTPSPARRGMETPPKSDEKEVSSFFENLLAK